MPIQYHRTLFADLPPIEIVQFSDEYLVNRTEDYQNYNVEIQAKTLKT